MVAVKNKEFCIWNKCYFFYPVWGYLTEFYILSQQKTKEYSYQ